MRGRWLVVSTMTTLALLGLMRTPRFPEPLHPVEPPQPIDASLGTRFDPARTGELTCRVLWEGDLPKVAPISLFQAKVRPGGQIELPNPNAPRVSKGHGLGDVVVSIRGIELPSSRPWDLSPVRVEQTQADFKIRQGERTGRIGVVRRGGSVEFIARDASMQSVRARGAAFFSQMLFTPDQAVSRSFPESGVVELLSGSGHFWMRGYLAVSDHPYVSISNADGSCRFEQVPEGSYELLAWKANWNIDRIERDPEWLFQSDLYYRAAVIKKTPIQIRTGKPAEVELRFRQQDFASP